MPIMFISAAMLIKKKVQGYLMAPIMMVFAVLTNVNSIFLMVVAMQMTSSNNIPMIIAFCIFTLICLGFLWLFLKNSLDSSKNHI